MVFLRQERRVHRVHRMIVVRVPNLPVLMTTEEFKVLCEECFSNIPLKSANFKMAVMANTAISKDELPLLEREFVRYIERLVVGERGELMHDRAYFGKLAMHYALDFFEVSRWFYRKFSYTVAKVEWQYDDLMTITTYRNSIVPLPELLRRNRETWRFLLSDIEMLVGGWWDFRFSKDNVNWFRVRKGEVFRDFDFEFLPKDM